MKVATKGHKPEWFDRPANVVGVNVCRLSGQLPNAGCGHIEQIGRDGGIELRSMIYTEYFVRGTQPRVACSLHPQPVVVAAAAASAELSGIGVEDGLPGEITATTGVSAPTRPEPRAEPTENRRGFWSRLFGRGGNDDERRKQEEQKKREEEKRRQEELAKKKKGGGGGQ